MIVIKDAGVELLSKGVGENEELNRK